MILSKNYKKHVFSSISHPDDCLEDFINFYQLTSITDVLYRKDDNYYLVHIHKAKKMVISYWIISISDYHTFNLIVSSKKSDNDTNFTLNHGEVK